MNAEMLSLAWKRWFFCFSRLRMRCDTELVISAISFTGRGFEEACRDLHVPPRLTNSTPTMNAKAIPGRPESLNFLAGGGEMGGRIRAFPGRIPCWGRRNTGRRALRTSLRILLTTQHPVFIFWGAELTCFYNDAYSRSLGPEKHPSMLGMPGRDRPGPKSGTSSVRRSTR